MRILIGLIEHLGDIVACEPVSRYLKYKNPGAQLTWAVAPAYRELIDTNPYIDETLELQCLTDWIKLTKHGSYDEIVDLHVNYRICQHCGIPLVKERGNPFVNVYEWFDYGTLQEAFTLGAGLPPLSAQPNVYLKPEHAKAVDALALPEDYCVVHRESNDVAKDWKDDAWRKLTEWIKNDLHLQVVEVGAGRTRAPSPLVDGHVNVVNRLPILQTAEVIRRARFFIGVDSGPAHVANALRTPGVVLIGRYSVFRQYMPFNGFFNTASPRVKIVRNLAGPVSALSVTEVQEAVRYVWEATATGRDSVSDTHVKHLWRTVRPPTPSSRCSQDHRDVLDSGFFDAAWYAVQYPDVLESGMDPVDHFLAVGAAEGRSPGPDFDARRYLQANADVAQAGVNPLLHYLRSGRTEGRQPYSLVSAPFDWPQQIERGANGANASASIRIQGDGEGTGAFPGSAGSQLYPRTFAFYLPQFHPISENNWAHGPGFTEWHSVVKAKPLFRGHYQPRIPGELGFYDLRSTQVLREQLRLATDYGISGFCFYYYYFQGRKLLYQPIKNYVELDVDAPFFLLWANENWSKRWDGGDHDVIIEQKHSEEDDLAFIRALLPLFQDARYVKIGGRPLLLIYKPHLFPDTLRTTDLWREAVVKHGLPGLYLVMVDDWFNNQFHPRQYGFDATYEIPSNHVPEQVLSTEIDALDLVDGFEGRIVDYRKFASFHLGRPFPEYKRLRTVMLPWDNTPRYGMRAIVHVNGDGDAYRSWLIQALLDTYRRYPPEERIVFLHSWNEWCEGTYLEPDGKLGRMFLEQTREAIRIVQHAIDLMKSSPVSTPIMAELLKTMQAKDEGAFRVMHATRVQTAYVWRELLKTREDLARAQEALAACKQEVGALQDSLSQAIHKERLIRADRDAICSSRSWRLTRPLRAIASNLRGQF